MENLGCGGCFFEQNHIQNDCYLLTSLFSDIFMYNNIFIKNIYKYKIIIDKIKNMM